MIQTRIKQVIGAAALASTLAMASQAAADRYQIRLGETELGHLDHTGAGAQVRLSSRISGTPLGVFNGTFGANTQSDGATITYRSESASSRKNRSIEIDFTGNVAQQTRVTPQEERTALSDPADVPAGALDPVRSFAHLAASDGCPTGFRMYDGRRVITIAAAGRAEEADMTRCTMAYRVTQGPGHLSPLRITDAQLELDYRAGALVELRAAAAGFELALTRLP